VKKIWMYLKPCLIGLFMLIAALFAPFVVLFALPFIRWDREETVDGMGRFLIVRGDLPNWLSYLGTPDERLPGGLYEPTVLSIYNKTGKWFTAWYWLGLRNRIHGLAASFGRIVEEGWPNPIDNSDEYYVRGDLWWRRKPIWGGKFAFKAGYRIYHLTNGTYRAVPCFTITKK
jgi:hypothetical protein